jgi:hypothetical protein
MSKNINKVNEEKLRIFLAKQKKKNDIKQCSKQVGGVGLKPSAN